MAKHTETITRSKISIEHCQVKSAEKLRLMCKALDTLEKELGIHCVEIYVNNLFVCPDIDLWEFKNSSDAMEQLIGKLLIDLDLKQYKSKSKYHNFNNL